MLNLSETIKEAFQKQRALTGVTLDIKGAYDHVLHQFLIDKLQDRNCPAYLLRSLQSFLTDRPVYANNAGLKSDCF